MKKILVITLLICAGCTKTETSTTQEPPSSTDTKTVEPSEPKKSKKDDAKSADTAKGETSADEKSDDEKVAESRPPEKGPAFDQGGTKITTQATPDDFGGPAVGNKSPADPPHAADAPAVAKSGLAAAESDQAVAGTPASNAAEAAATGRGPSQPEGSNLRYTPADGPRIRYYKLFVADTLSSDDLVKLLFQDPEFNRSVTVLGDLYRQDKFNGSLSPDKEIKFQQVGQRLKEAVTIYNQDKRSEHYKDLGGSAVVGALVGAAAGGLFMREEWVPPAIRAKIGDRIPSYVRDPIIGGVAGASVVLVTMETYHVLSEWVDPGEVYNADPLLDAPSR